MWGYQGTPDIPIIIDDGTSRILYDLFDTDGGYPDNIFIDHNMNVYNITELEMDESSINNIIQSMLDEIPTSVSYEDDIQPIFNQHCTTCHGNAAGLNLTSYTYLMNGANSGPVIIPGDHANSSLWMEVDSGDMPPYGNLLDSQINLIAQWIDAGACENSNDILDECGACVSTNDTSCIEGCDGNYANDGTHFVYDDCGVCDGDNSTCSDCAGMPNGTSIIDECGACVSNNDTSCIQGCDGNYANDGTQQADDECGVCGGDNSTCSDCTGTPNGTSIIDECGACVSSDDTSCIQGCDGNYANDGTHLEEDACGVCNGGVNDVSNCIDCPESDPADCLGVCGGSAVNDECGVCGGDNSTCLDCAGTPNGTSIIDECGACVSTDDTTCVQGCDGNYANDGTQQADDECGVCGGDNLTCSDCTGIPNGTSNIDECGICVSSDDTSCVQGCDGNYANDGTHLLDDECGVCGGDGSSCLSIVDNIIREFSIDRVYPNPFNPVVNIDFSLSTSSFINIFIYDLNGQIVDNLYSGYKSIGSHSIVWNASNMSSGIYVMLLETNQKSISQQLILLK